MCFSVRWLWLAHFLFYTEKWGTKVVIGPHVYDQFKMEEQMKKLISFAIVLAALLTLVSCGGKVYEAEAKEFTSNGMTITLTKSFVENTQQGYTVCYDSNAVAVIALKEAFTMMEGFEDWTLEAYADAIYQNNAANNPTTPTKVGDRMVMEYTFFNPDTDITYHYYTCMYKGSDGFWMIQFACDVNEIEEYKPYMIEWADSVRV